MEFEHKRNVFAMRSIQYISFIYLLKEEIKQI